MKQRNLTWVGVGHLAICGLLLLAISGHQIRLVSVAVVLLLLCSAFLTILAGTILDDLGNIRRAAGVATMLEGAVVVGGYQIFVDLGTYPARVAYYAAVIVGAFSLVGVGIEIVRGNIDIQRSTEHSM
ncbi:hypothetical protein OB920_04905 [Halobacteria archaeon HArc-gm2]|nr:hypothetical protein [Halobacteria archaeon HArc-gm2]